MKLKITVVLCVLLSLTACAGSKDLPQETEKPAVVEHLTQNGQIYKREINVKSEDWADAQIAQSNSECWVGITSASTLPPMPSSSDATALLAWGLVASNQSNANTIAKMSNSQDPCPLAKNSNDVGIAKEQGKTERSVAKTQAVEGVVGSVMNGALIYKGISTAGKVVGSFVDGMGTTNNIQAGGNVHGAIGEGNEYSSTEQVSGILTETAPVNPISFDGSEQPTEDPATCEDPRDLIPVEVGSLEDVSGCFDTNQNRRVCSTGGDCFDI